MTATTTSSTLPALRRTGVARQLVLLCASALTWIAAVVVMVAGFVPEIDGDDTEVQIQIGFVLAGLAVAALPVLVLWLPERRAVSQALDALLASADSGPVLPSFDQWSGPGRMFERLRGRCALAAVIPLLTLLGFAVAYGVFLDEGAAAIICGTFSVVPLLALVASLTLSRRLSAGVRAGLEAGQVVPLTVERRLDEELTLRKGSQSWFDARLPDGQPLMLRTPVHFASDSDARGVVESPDLVLVIGRGGHQGVLLDPSRPQDAVWLLGPVPLTRVPISVLEELAASAG